MRKRIFKDDAYDVIYIDGLKYHKCPFCEQPQRAIRKHIRGCMETHQEYTICDELKTNICEAKDRRVNPYLHRK